ncbi:MAG: hypothetical protein Q4F67_15560, partial [Propionibacteriaceae bacterium]|nr:hypothetical protein [Propionibacteriaceae bacterium]
MSDNAVWSGVLPGRDDGVLGLPEGWVAVPWECPAELGPLAPDPMTPEERAACPASPGAYVVPEPWDTIVPEVIPDWVLAEPPEGFGEPPQWLFDDPTLPPFPDDPCAPAPAVAGSSVLA